MITPAWKDRRHDHEGDGRPDRGRAEVRDTEGPQMSDRISVELQGQTRAVVTVATDRGDGGLVVERPGTTLTGVFADTMPADVVALLVEALPQANHAWFRLFGGPDPDDIVVP